MSSGMRCLRASSLALLALLLWLSPSGTQAAGSKPMKMTPGPSGGMGMGHSGKPNMKLPVKEVAPAVTAMLKPAGTACGHTVKGGGMVRLIPVHVGRMSGPHVELDIMLHGAGAMTRYGVSGIFEGKPPIKWQGMAESDMTDMHGNLMVKTRLMPMLRAGRYRARIMLHDMNCGGGMRKPLAYQTGWIEIVLK